MAEIVSRPYRVAIKDANGSVKYYRVYIKDSNGVTASYKTYIKTSLDLGQAGIGKANGARAG